MAATPTSAIEFDVTVEGLDELEDLFVKLRARLAAPFKDVGLARRLRKKYTDRVKEAYRTQGSIYGGWAQLSPTYAAWKSQHFPGRPLLVLTGQMERETTRPSESKFVYKRTDTKITLGSSNKLAARHQAGARKTNLPARPLFILDGRFSASIVKETSEQIFRGI